MIYQYNYLTLKVVAEENFRELFYHNLFELKSWGKIKLRASHTHTHPTHTHIHTQTHTNTPVYNFNPK